MIYSNHHATLSDFDDEIERAILEYADKFLVRIVVTPTRLLHYVHYHWSPDVNDQIPAACSIPNPETLVAARKICRIIVSGRPATADVIPKTGSLLKM